MLMSWLNSLYCYEELRDAHSSKREKGTSGKAQFDTLLQAFEYCDPTGTGYITDRARFALVARVLANEQAGEDAAWSYLDQDGNGRVSFPEFVEWAERSHVQIAIGVEGDGGPGGVAYPHNWQGPKDGLDWNMRTEVVDPELFRSLQDLLNTTYKKVWTRDRKSTGINEVPSAYQLVRALHSENYRDWRRYYLKRHRLVHDCKSTGFEMRPALTSQAEALCARHRLQGKACNEWLLFHGTQADAAEAICRGDFTMNLAGSATGTLYGRGTYFGESITKADEYARPDSSGNCCVLLCRVAGGRVLYNDEVSPDSQLLQDHVLSGEFHSIVGDREKCRGTFKEYVVFDADQVYVEYALFYRRIFES